MGQIDSFNEATMSPTIIRKSSHYDDTLAEYPQLIDKLGEFLRAKVGDFNTRFGASDKPFASGGNYNNAVPGIKHAHLNSDVSVVYNIHGANPRFLDLYGLFSHADLGTGQPPNMKKQKSRAKAFSNEKFANLAETRKNPR